ncbi:unnamed protein product [Paramecium octaurelia]|uniref:Uncharacterized protein n=1 Tax=Paramecium octaurelia TaxID=43137 RepID=A0A8S1XW07_PAROT|nr:unnamed protein product [Paramecium octaurelia]
MARTSFPSQDKEQDEEKNLEGMIKGWLTAIYMTRPDNKKEVSLWDICKN